MKALLKTATLNVRLSAHQRREIERAADAVTRERGEVVEPSTLFRECGMAGVREILAKKSLAAA